MTRGALVCLAAVVMMAATLLCVGAIAASPVTKAFPAATLLSQAEDAWQSDAPRFRDLLAQLHRHEGQLTIQQRWHLRWLDTRQLSFDSHYDKADPILSDIMDHSGDQALSIRAMASLIRNKFLSRQYVDAYALANTLMAELPKVSDPRARLEGMSQIIIMLDRVAVGQYDLALQYTRQMRASLPSGKAQCVADVFEIENLLYVGKTTASSPEVPKAVDACLAAKLSGEIISLRLDLASEMVDEGHADQAIALLDRIAPEVHKSGYAPYLASLPVSRAQAYLSLGNADKARQYALASIAITGTSSPLWTLKAAYEVLYKAEKMDGHDAAALSYYEKYAAQNAAAMDDAKASALAYQMVKQQVQAKKMQLDALGKQNSILQLRQALASQAQKTSRLFNVLLLVVLAFIALAMFWLKRSQLRFRHMARHDGLTGAFNREHFFAEAGHTLRRLHKAKAGVCLVVLDLDHFKQVNDTYGHAAGDEVLQRTVDVCRQELRGSDVFGRLGGEEFGILMPACSRGQGIEIATRIRRALAATAMVLNAQTTVQVSASFGLACCTSSERTLHQLLREADLALYRAKDAGRNQVNAGVDAPARDQSGAEVVVGG